MKILWLILMLLASHVSLAQIYVDQSATGANDGSSWVDAFTDIQVAIDNGTVLIEEGIYM